MEEKSNRLQFKILIPQKSIHIPRFLATKSAEDQPSPPKHEIIAPIIMTPRFEEKQDLTPERSS